MVSICLDSDRFLTVVESCGGLGGFGLGGGGGEGGEGRRTREEEGGR